MPSDSPTALIIGAGLAGSLTACYLAKAGWRVKVFERRPDPRQAGYQGGRSINLALSARGLAGLAGAGLADLVMQQDAIPMRGRMIHLPNGSTTILQPYSHDPKDAINSVSRGGLNLTLIKAAAAYPNVSFEFDQFCIDLDLEGSAPFAGIFSGPKGAQTVAEADLIIGADGAFSAVRGKLQKTDRYDYSQSYLEHGYKELHIPPAKNGEFAMDPNALHIWPRGGAMMIALPNRDHSFTCTLFWPFRGEHGFDTLTARDEVEAHFTKHYPDAVPLMPTLVEDFFKNPTSSLVTVRCYPWQHAGRVVLIGDAAHAVVPFYGQGMNAAFEDCLALAQLLEKHPGQREGTGLRFTKALDEFQQLRKPNADAIADMALENFVEMRDRTGQPAFLYSKKIEQTIHHFFPEQVTPQYNLVSFSTVPYTEARERGKHIAFIVAAVAAKLPAESVSQMDEATWKDRVRAIAEPLLRIKGDWGFLAPRQPDAAHSGRAEAWKAIYRAWNKPSSNAPGKHSDQPEPRAIVDITPAITDKLGVWPGDTPLSREVLCDIAKGDTITLSTLRATVHLGAHADGPNHYGKAAPGIGERKLDHYLGLCHVIDAPARRGTRLTPADLKGGLDQVRHPRVLLKTGSFPDPNHWNEDFAALSVELVDALASKGVITIGIDTPSVDLQTSKDLPAHHAILRHDIAILEGLDLSQTPAGEYELIALPLKLIGFDASPVRAILRPL